MRFLFIIVTVISITNGLGQSYFGGKIGTYDIELSLERLPGLDSVIGKYNYAEKTSSLQLKGSLLPENVIYLVESVDEKETGFFYLYFHGQNISGYWTNGDNHYDVNLNYKSGKTDLEPTLPQIHDSINMLSIEGMYDQTESVIDLYDIDNHNFTFGTNGGSIAVSNARGDSCLITFDLVCGPTYHIATFGGYAHLTGFRVYEFNKPLYGDSPCQLKFVFQNGRMILEQNSSPSDCGFGARAYTGGLFTKVSNTPQEIEH
jgi:hypothetical protein